MSTLFKEKNGKITSMRRVLAFIFSVISILISIGLIVVNYFTPVEFKFVLALIVPFLASTIVLLFFTTWNDVASVVKAVKGDNS